MDAKNDENGSPAPSPEPENVLRLLLSAFERTNQLLLSLNTCVHQLAHATAQLTAAQEEMNSMLLSLRDAAADDEDEPSVDLSGAPIRTS